jgi:hypothetical protein
MLKEPSNMVLSLDCPQCGAPLPLQAAQTLAACVYSNATVHIGPAAAPGRMQAPPVAVRAVEVRPEVIDEVKRMLLLGQHVLAAEYYSRQARVSTAVAEIAVRGIEQNMAYLPPLTAVGVAVLVGLEGVSSAALVGGVALMNNAQYLLGIGLVLVGLLLTLGSTLVLMKGLPGFILAQRGKPATAQILKRWVIRTNQVKGVPVELTRLLLEVRPAERGAAPYQAEANCFVTEPSKPKFTVGSLIQVKYSPSDRGRLVVTGAGPAP